MPNDATNIIREVREKQDINYANVCFQHSLSIAFSRSRFVISIRLWLFHAGRNYASAMSPEVSISWRRIRERAPSTHVCVRSQQYVSVHPHSLYAGEGDFSLYMEEARYELLTRLILGYAPTYLNSKLLSYRLRESFRPTIARIQ